LLGVDCLQGLRGRSPNVGVLVLQRFAERWDGGLGPRTNRRQGRGGAPADALVRVLQGNGQGGDGSLGPRAQDAQYDRGELAHLGVAIPERPNNGWHESRVVFLFRVDPPQGGRGGPADLQGLIFEGRDQRGDGRLGVRADRLQGRGG